MTKRTKKQARDAAQAMESRLIRLGKEKQAHHANNPRGRVTAARTEGLGISLRCPRCKTTTLGSRKAIGNKCLLTRGCHGRLVEVPNQSLQKEDNS